MDGKPRAQGKNPFAGVFWGHLYNIGGLVKLTAD
jgi:hypothetical protein